MTGIGGKRTLRRPHHSGNFDAVEVEEAESALRQAQAILARPGHYEPEEWMLLATLVGEADLAVRHANDTSADLRLLLDQVVGELREATDGFTNPKFVKASGAARRRNKVLFCGTA